MRQFILSPKSSPALKYIISLQLLTKKKICARLINKAFHPAYSGGITHRNFAGFFLYIFTGYAFIGGMPAKEV
ncbi:hypothetical protein CSTERLE_10000 [Thermoclostridium stercorarium subsp. leptospartum DSM 9219]|uniref:Uncharacterized protein n=1 Tax=Thermoclostridium stercorarium subsp. leptospartum DSM 9219 TaxID=1346611 RepID=A0A1B1YM97_THEST|nr:hypothetical protein CSTERLE_10000 [Thermoclostridium stercorarium subsp. leptospartum DSM 9219]